MAAAVAGRPIQSGLLAAGDDRCKSCTDSIIVTSNFAEKMLPGLLSPLNVRVSVVFISAVQKCVTVCDEISS